MINVSKWFAREQVKDIYFPQVDYILMRHEKSFVVYLQLFNENCFVSKVYADERICEYEMNEFIKKMEE